MNKALVIVQMVFACLLMVVILLQNQGTGVSGLFGGSGGVYRTKRGIEKTLFYSTIIFSIIFLGLSLAVVII